MKKKRLIPWLLCFLLVFATSSLVFLNQAQAAPTQTAGKAENYTGWKTISGQKYYYRNGKALKGLKKVGKYYYFLAETALCAQAGRESATSTATLANATEPCA